MITWFTWVENSTSRYPTTVNSVRAREALESPTATKCELFPFLTFLDTVTFVLLSSFNHYRHNCLKNSGRGNCPGLQNVHFFQAPSWIVIVIQRSPPHKSHNTPLLPPKSLHRNCFRLLLGHFHVSGEISNNGYAKVLGGNIEVYYGIAQVVNYTS